jgi:hypothetical protein
MNIQRLTSDALLSPLCAVPLLLSLSQVHLRLVKLRQEVEELQVNVSKERDK